MTDVPEQQGKPMTTVYTASKMRHAWMWQQLRAGGLNVISTWIDEAMDKESPSLPDLWERCVREASEADCTLVYADHSEAPEVMKGALVEVGAALASGKTAYAVGVSESDGSWVNHPLVVQCRDLDHALRLISSR